MNPDYGYYATRDPLGAAGDFTTAPEISQMFGEMLGLCLAQAWLDQGRLAPFVLAEIGPGRGTLMADILRTIRAVPGMAEAAELHLIEASPALRAKQAETLKDNAPHWHDSIATLPDGPLFLVANEFFDALPIRQFERRADGWAERQVGLKDGALLPGLAPPAPAALYWPTGWLDTEARRYRRTLPRLARHRGRDRGTHRGVWWCGPDRRLWRLAFAWRYISGAERITHRSIPLPSRGWPI